MFSDHRFPSPLSSPPRFSPLTQLHDLLFLFLFKKTDKLKTNHQPTTNQPIKQDVKNREKPWETYTCKDIHIRTSKHHKNTKLEAIAYKQKTSRVRSAQTKQDETKGISKNTRACFVLAICWAWPLLLSVSCISNETPLRGKISNWFLCEKLSIGHSFCVSSGGSCPLSPRSAATPYGLDLCSSSVS